MVCETISFLLLNAYHRLESRTWSSSSSSLGHALWPFQHPCLLYLGIHSGDIPGLLQDLCILLAFQRKDISTPLVVLAVTVS